MSGESQRDDDPDFLDDDFVVEDISGKNEDLDQLFEVPQGSAPKARADGEKDSDDVLFTDHTKGLDASTTFQGGGQFAEANASGWNGDNLELDEASVPADEESAARAGGRSADGDAGEEDFGLDSERDLEVVGAAPAGDGVDEFEQSGPFVLDDGEGTWQEDQEVAAEAVETAAEAIEEAAEELVEPALAAVDGEETVEPGWEPLPSTNVDELAEVDEVARTDEYGEPIAAESEAEAEGELVGAGVGEDVEGHDIYATEAPARFVGGRRRGRAGRMVMALAASVTLLAAAAVVVLRPELIGLHLEPARVDQVRVTRPEVAVNVAPPKPVEVAVAKPPADPVTPPADVTPKPPTEVVQATLEPKVEPKVEPPVEVPTPPVDTAPTQPVAVTPENPAPPAPDAAGWPGAVEPRRSGQQAGLVRISENLKVGEQTGEQSRPVRAVEGIMPGAKAFAQLHNGNYFIGSVKGADADRITLRIDNGEVTLHVAAIARLTELGSADYEQLQKVTSGFVRLTNNNRLVGGILRHIADDHVVLEVRSNRVMVPKSAIGEVVQGQDESPVRLDTTKEEDDWLRRLAERQLGTGQGAPLPTPAPAPDGGGTRKD